MSQPRTVDIKPLHELLKHRPDDAESLRVTITADGEEETTVQARGGETRLRHSPQDKPERIIRSMLRHYPVAAFVNGEEVQRTPFRQTVYLHRHAQKGDMMRRNIRRIQVHPQAAEDDAPAEYVKSVALAQGLAYDLNLPEAKKTCALPAEPWNAKRNNIRPVEVWEANHRIELTEAEAAGAGYELVYGSIARCYNTGEETCKTVQAQTAQAEEIIRRFLPSAPIPDWGNDNPHRVRTGERIFRIWSPESDGAAAHLSEMTVAAAPDDGENSQGICYSLTRALLQNPDAGVLPALPQNEAKAAIHCEKAVVKWSDGWEIVLKGEELAEGEAAVTERRCPCPPQEQCGGGKCDPLEPFKAERSLADSITLTLNLKCPGQPDRAMDLPAGILCAGVIYDNHTWVTRKDWPQDVLNQAIRHTAEIEFNAIWNINDQVTYNYIDDDFRAHRLAWWTRVFQGEQTGFNHELDRLAGQFYPQSNRPQAPQHSLNGGYGSSLTWRPEGTWDWLDGIIQRKDGSSPEAARLKLVTEVAQEILIERHKDEIEAAVAEAIRQCPAQEPA